MSVQRIIQESVNKNPLGLKEAFAEELSERVRLALEAKMGDEIEEDFELDEEFEEDLELDESEDQLDEISGSKLGSYYVKARKSKDDAIDKQSKLFTALKTKDDIPAVTAKNKALARKISNRGRGMSRAMDKLAGSGFAKVHATD
jgi:hypothetical protein